MKTLRENTALLSLALVQRSVPNSERRVDALFLEVAPNVVM